MTSPCNLQDAEEGLASASAAAETTGASIHEMEASLDKHRFVPTAPSHGALLPANLSVCYFFLARITY
jgi:hypothetical protein